MPKLLQHIPSRQLNRQLQLVNSPLEKAQIYAREGIWYDTLDWANHDRSDSQSSGYWQQLLTDIVKIPHQENLL